MTVMAVTHPSTFLFRSLMQPQTMPVRIREGRGTAQPRDLHKVHSQSQKRMESRAYSQAQSYFSFPTSCFSLPLHFHQDPDSKASSTFVYGYQIISLVINDNTKEQCSVGEDLFHSLLTGTQWQRLQGKRPRFSNPEEETGLARCVRP